MHSRRAAPFNNEGDQVHLRKGIDCSTKKCRDELGLSPPFDWEYAVLTFDSSKGQWMEIKQTFDDFADADNLFCELSKQKFSDLDVSRLEIDAQEHGASSSRPTTT
jgi:hypothetical protein